jgi:hypothetical protein
MAESAGARSRQQFDQRQRRINEEDELWRLVLQFVMPDRHHHSETEPCSI